MIPEAVRFIDQRTSAAPFAKKVARYVFPDHWSFLLGEVALYSFVVLVGTGIYLTLFYEPSTAHTIYQGSYAPLQGREVTHAYNSVVHLSLDVKAGLLIRQTHHWAANVFIAAIVMHVLRIFFTGAYRKPREVTYLVGVVMLFVALVEGYAGYSMVDDLLSGMGLAIGYGVALSIPLIGANLAELVWGHPFPGDPEFFSRMYIAHVFLFPMLIATLIGVHLALVSAKHHTQFRRDRARGERKVVGIPTFPGYVPRTLGVFTGVGAALFLLGGLVQINPIWLWGPFEVGQSTNGAQPDWYLGWLIGALRLLPGFDLTIGGYTLVPNPFWGGALFPLIVLAALVAWPWLEQRVTKDYAFHNVLDRPRDAPWRTAIGAAFFTWVVLVFATGSADRVTVAFGLSYVAQIWVYRVAIWVVPLVVLVITHRICRELQEADRIDEERLRAEAEGKAAIAPAGAALAIPGPTASPTPPSADR